MHARENKSTFRPYKADVPNASHKLPALVIEAQYQQLLSYPQQHLERFGWRQWNFSRRQWGSTASCL
jgi:hypothetical protein